MKTYLTATQVCRRYGGKSDSWLWRLLQSDPKFPRPVYLKNKRLFLEAALEEYDQRLPIEVDLSENCAPSPRKQAEASA